MQSKEAARAIADGLPILAKAHRVIVLSISAEADERANEGQAAAHIDAYLRRHSVRPRAIRHLHFPHADIAELLLSQASNVGAIVLIVMGAYGHARLRELVLGGVTRSMLLETTLPVLMSH